MARKNLRTRCYRERGVAAILAMMFLVILGSLAAAMAIVSQGNLTTADSHLKINRALAASETGMRFLVFRLNQVTQTITTTDGIIDESNAELIWTQTRNALLASLQNELHNDDAGPNKGEPFYDELADTLSIGPIMLGAGQPTFRASFRPHPIQEENYNAAFYQRSPYKDLNPPVSMGNPLDETWIRVTVNAEDGPVGRSIQMDFRLEKKIEFAVLSKSRVMIGRNVLIDGPIGSRFMDTHLEHGHPIQMASDFRGINATLDTELDGFIDDLELRDEGGMTVGDVDGDNRLNLSDPAEAGALDTPGLDDVNNDGYVDGYDYFLDVVADGDDRVTLGELEFASGSPTHAAQLMELIDTFGDPDRDGYDDGVIDNDDRYIKLKGEVKIAADLGGWLGDPDNGIFGAAQGRYQDFFQGSILAKHGEEPLTFQSEEATVQSYGPSDFDVSEFHNRTTEAGSLSLTQQASSQVGSEDNPEAAMDITGDHLEEVPYGAAHPYDYYNRPVYENMTFENVEIPKGTNALFKNCTFVGVTFIDSNDDNGHENFNYAGIKEADGTLKYPGIVATVDENPVTDTKSESNNIRFHGCTFEGAVVANPTSTFTHVRNKISFTGETNFDIDNSTSLSDEQKAEFKRSAILAPHYSVEIGSFNDPASSNEVVNLSGTIVAGVIDIRGQAKINGTILTTFEPTAGEAPVVGDTSPQFNTTLGYFPSAQGDLEAEMPANGLGVIHIRYDPTLGLPNGILGPIYLTPVASTYSEGSDSYVSYSGGSHSEGGSDGGESSPH